jgi:hypothetical protein
MAEKAHHQQLAKFENLFQALESSLIGVICTITGEDYAAEILPAETRYRRLVGSADVIFSRFVDLLREPDPEAKTRFHNLMERCLDIGEVRDRCNHSQYGLLRSAADVAAPGKEKAAPGCEDDSPRQLIPEDLSAASVEPYIPQITKALAELESFRLQVTDWKSAGK